MKKMAIYKMKINKLEINKKKLFVRTMQIFLCLCICVSFLKIVMVGTLVGVAAGKVKKVKQIDATTTASTIKWDAVAGNGVEYQVYESRNQKQWRFCGTTVKNEFVVDKLSPAKRYFVKVRAVIGTSAEIESDIIQIVTAPEAVSNVRQTDGMHDRVSLKWNALAGIDCYYIYNDYTKPIVLDNPKKNQTSIAGLSANSSYTFYVAGVIISKEGYVAIGETMRKGDCSVETKTAPGKLNSSEYVVSYEAGDSEIMISTNPPAGANGTQIRFYVGKGKKVIGTYGQSVTFPANKYQNKFICFRARAYCYHHGQIYYGPWTRYRYFANMNIKTSCKKQISTVSWKKVKGAESYEVYLSKKQSRGWKLVATVGDNKLNLIRYGNMKFKKGQTCYIKIVPYFHGDEGYVPSDIAGYARVRIR